MKRTLLVLFCMLSLSAVYAQNGFWAPADGRPVSAEAKLARDSHPSKYHLFTLNLQGLKQQLQTAPLRKPGAFSKVIVSFPDGNGMLKNFRIYEAPVMEAALAKKYPDTKSYVGQGVDNPSDIIRFSITGYGLHTMLSTIGETAYTDPYTKDGSTYIVYKKADLFTDKHFSCGVTEAFVPQNHKASAKNGPLTTFSTDGIMRTYRLAMACTIEYAAFHINAAGVQDATVAQKKQAVLDAMVATVTRVNSVYERDLAITLVLVANNDQLIFIDSDNFDNSNTDNILLEQSQQTIDAIIGFNNYDIGHTVSTGGGGVAQLQSPCSGSKAKGITGLGSPVGDAFDIDYVAHEMGHQFGGNHSFNNECGGNRNDSTAYEPGSGTTIMAYAGVCAPNVQPHSDAHFHNQSITEMTAFITTGGDCGQNTVTGNIPPVIDVGPDYTIPFGTPFILEGKASDANNDALSYCWEQMNRQISVQPPLPDSPNGPNFRSLPPKGVPQRYMPDIENVLENNLAPTWEVVATVARFYTFALTVRDNNLLGGQAVIDSMRVNVSGIAGPFLIQEPNTNVSWAAGTTQTVTWDVAGTTANNINTAYVDIFLSTDGGHTYPVQLAYKVPNDGSETVTVPNITGAANRIMVKGFENIFYDLTNTDFTITAPESTMAIAPAEDQNSTACAGQPVSYTLAYTAYNGFTGQITFSVTGNPAGTTVTFSPEIVTASGNVIMTIAGADENDLGFYAMAVTATSGAVTKTVNLYMELISAQFGTVALNSPENGAENVSDSTVLTWDEASGATGYIVEVSTDANFTNITNTYMVATTTLTAALEQGTHYYWRVTPKNSNCQGTPSGIFNFTTWLLNCAPYASDNVPLAISDSQEVTVTSVLNVAQEPDIEKMKVNVAINHTWIADVTVKLKSPQGTEIILFSQQCDDKDNVNAVFDDNGAVFSCGTNPAISGSVQPLQELSTFDGENPQGVWTLTVSDNFDQDGGALLNWGITFCVFEEVLGSHEVTYTNAFTVFPNPNQGSFIVKYNSVTGNDIKISVYDMRGRQVAGQFIRGTVGAIEQPLTLAGAAAGIYMVVVQDGLQVQTQKVIVH